MSGLIFRIYHHNVRAIYRSARR